MTSAKGKHKKRSNPHRNRYLVKQDNSRWTWTCGKCGYRQNLRDEKVCHRCFAPRQP